MTCSYYLTTVGVLIGPLILPQKFPTDAVYPFPVEHPIVKCLVYLHQCIVGFQCSAGMALDCQIALFLWYLGARYEILASKGKNITSIKSFHAFIEEHQDLLSCTNEIIHPIKVITLATVISTRIGMIFGGIVLVSSSTLMSDKIFETCFYQTPIMRTKWCFIIQRTQKPVIIKVSGIFNALSYEFYSTFLSTAFSYFTALRVLVKS
ncbi:uncharacterized protein [Chelonus insularis]|uniref:uncharacterized protein n=1 Tax=Chelonus insularis TaxID=460826 RepID=UPI00158CFEF2|nr:uncharacterized protein LOC118069124 [Chelonus insularis]